MSDPDYDKIVKMLVYELKAMLIPELANLMGSGPEGWMTTSDLAAHLKVCEDTIRTWAKQGCPHIRAAKGSHRFLQSQVVAWLQSPAKELQGSNPR